jgi:D-3-phosphoglycerate dehydrogenase/C-terminal binding protein
MSHFRVVITDFIPDPPLVERNILTDVATVEALDANAEHELVGRVEHADAIMLYHNLAIREKTIRRLDRCKLIVRCGVGYDNVDWAFAESRGIAVANVPDYGTEEVADSAIGMMLSMTRGINLLNSRLRDKRGPWFYTQAAPLHRLRGRVFGVIGLGRIGTATAHRARALGMDVVFYDPYKPDGYDKTEGVRRVETLEELLSQSFVLSVHCPNSPETRHMIDADAIAQLPRGAYLVNTARGAIVDTVAIPPAIASGRLAGAGIDVLDREPPADDEPLVAAWRDPNHPCHDRVLLNPHSAFYSEEGLHDMRSKGAIACRRALLGEPLRNVVNDSQAVAPASGRALTDSRV